MIKSEKPVTGGDPCQVMRGYNQCLAQLLELRQQLFKEVAPVFGILIGDKLVQDDDVAILEQRYG